MTEFDSSFVTEKPKVNPPTVDEVVLIEARGPWPTKSKGELRVLSAIPYDLTVKNHWSIDQWHEGLNVLNID